MGVNVPPGPLVFGLVEVVIVVVFAGVLGSVLLGLFRVVVPGGVSPHPLGGVMGMCLLASPGGWLPGLRFLFRSALLD